MTRRGSRDGDRKDVDRRARDAARMRTARRAARTAKATGVHGPALPTAADVRQVIPVPDVATRVDTLRAAAARCGAPVGRSGQRAGTALPSRPRTLFESEYVTEVWRLVGESGAPATVEHHYALSKRNPCAGRKAKLSARTVVTGMLLTALDGRPLLVSEVAFTLFHRLRPSETALLDVVGPVADPVRAHLPGRALARRNAEYGLVRRGTHRVLAAVDPSIHPKNRNHPWLRLMDLNRDLSVEEQELQAAMDTVCAQLLSIPFSMLPETVRARYKGNVGLDATPAATYARSRGLHNSEASTDPDAANYVRVGAHNEEAAYGPDGKRIRAVRKVIFGYDATMLVAADLTDGTLQYAPAIPVAIALDRPGCDPAGAARRVFAQFLATGHQPGYLAADGLYPSLTDEGFHEQVFQAGFEPLTWLPRRMLGRNGPLNGMVHVEGDYCCASLPDELANANLDYRDGLIDEETRETRLAERARYRMRPHEYETVQTLTGPVRVPIRWGCPASGGTRSAAAACPLKPASMGNRPVTRTPDGRKIGARLIITLIPEVKNNPPAPCRTEVIRASTRYDHLAHRQALPYGTRGWHDTYRRLRQSQAGFHGFAKDDAHQAIANAGRRRIRGLAGNTILLTLLVTAASIRKVARFLEEARDQGLPDSGLYVVRRTRPQRSYPFTPHSATDPPDDNEPADRDPDTDEAA